MTTVRTSLNTSIVRSYTIMSNIYVKRTTLFKIPKQEDIDAVLDQYAVLRKTALKVRKLPNHQKPKRISLPPLPAALAISRSTTLTLTNQDNQPYIISNTARKILNTDAAISGGYTVAAQSVFSSKEDHDFYDSKCPAHKELKVSLTGFPCTRACLKRVAESSRGWW